MYAALTTSLLYQVSRGSEILMIYKLLYTRYFCSFIRQGDEVGSPDEKMED